MDAFDLDGDGIIGADEAAQKITIQNAFAKYDRDRSGAINAAELKSLIDDLNPDEPLTEEEVEKALEMLDTDGDKTVDMREFTDWWLFRGDAAADAGSTGKKASELQKKLYVLPYCSPPYHRGTPPHSPRRCTAPLP
jgi:hypothetical protein